MHNKLLARIKSAERSLGATYGTDISTPRARRRAFWHFQLLDHAILRAFWANCHQIAPGVWRANQPSPRRLRKYHAMGIGTILSLRGANGQSPYLFEKEACDALGIRLINLAFSARKLAPRSVFLALLDAFEQVERPFLMHCKSGADRAGLASVLYLLHMTSTPIVQARKQLGPRYLHFRASQTGILDHMIDAYQADNAARKMPIRTWIEQRYDCDTLSAEFLAKRGKS
ncbi:dual specificity protein phosphatase family protein [Rhodobacteraceae bacterium R_SAG10]|nr:dual specificity protein phosphatase family protein [Rhodobacteraceae bacterium R_SAG10]